MRNSVRLGLAAALMAATPLAAQETGEPDAARLVENCRQSEQIILRIEACTRLIERATEGTDTGEDNPAWAFNNRALAFELAGRIDRALSDYNTALLLDPDFAAGYNNRGNLHARQGDLDAAIADHAQAVEIDPGYVEAWFNLGADHEDAGDRPAAVEAYSAALDADPDYTAALTSRAAVLCELGRVEASVADRLRLLETGYFSARDLQQFLKDRGYYDSVIDGIFGRGSRAALIAWTEAGCPRG